MLCRTDRQAVLLREDPCHDHLKPDGADTIHFLVAPPVSLSGPKDELCGARVSQHLSDLQARAATSPLPCIRGAHLAGVPSAGVSGCCCASLCLPGLGHSLPWPRGARTSPAQHSARLVARPWRVSRQRRNPGSGLTLTCYTESVALGKACFPVRTRPGECSQG